jgi:chromosome segregation ATPase
MRIAKDELTEESKELEEKRERLDEISNELAGKEVTISQSIENAVKEAIEKIENKNRYEVRYLNKENENKIALLESQLETCKNQNAELREEIKDVKTKLAAAYDKIENMAAKSIEGASNVSQIKTLEGLLKQAKTENNK